MTSEPRPQWFVVQQPDGSCAIAAQPPAGNAQHWGPFASRAEAIARRVDLIRSGRCQPR